MEIRSYKVILRIRSPGDTFDVQNIHIQLARVTSHDLGKVCLCKMKVLQKIHVFISHYVLYIT